jgi:hypothetical protein
VAEEPAVRLDAGEKGADVQVETLGYRPDASGGERRRRRRCRTGAAAPEQVLDGIA